MMNNNKFNSLYFVLKYFVLLILILCVISHGLLKKSFQYSDGNIQILGSSSSCDNGRQDIELAQMTFYQNMKGRRFKAYTANITEYRFVKGNAIRKQVEEIKNCPFDIHKEGDNILCATAATIDNYELPQFLPGLKSPCFFIKNNSGSFHILTNYSISDWSSKERDVIFSCLPAVVMIGERKSGTGDFYWRLSQHQDIPYVKQKEADFWRTSFYPSLSDTNGNYRYNLFAYMRYYHDASHKIISDIKLGHENASNRIMIDGSSDISTHLSSLVRFYPDMKFIMIMRDPVERLFSGHRFRKTTPKELQSPEGFHRTVVEKLSNDIITPLYFAKVRHVLDVCSDKKNVLFIKFEEYATDSFSVLNNVVYPFLGLPPLTSRAAKGILKMNQYNPTFYKYKMLNSTRQILRDYFRPYNHELARILGDNKWTWGY